MKVVEGGYGSLCVDKEDVEGSLGGAATIAEDMGCGDDVAVRRADDVLDVVWKRDLLCGERADPPLLYIVYHIDDVQMIVLYAFGGYTVVMCTQIHTAFDCCCVRK